MKKISLFTAISLTIFAQNIKASGFFDTVVDENTTVIHQTLNLLDKPRQMTPEHKEYLPIIRLALENIRESYTLESSNHDLATYYLIRAFRYCATSEKEECFPRAQSLAKEFLKAPGANDAEEIDLSYFMPEEDTEATQAQHLRIETFFLFSHMIRYGLGSDRNPDRANRFLTMIRDSAMPEKATTRAVNLLRQRA